jgi:LacI family transcriptional regulator
LEISDGMNLKDLSKSLGLSQTTVSRALNGYPEVSERTRERVLSAASQHDYRPNSRAKGLATGRSMAIGHVIAFSNQPEIVNPIFGDFISGCADVYARYGYDTLLSIVKETDETRTYRELCGRGAVDGVIIHSPLCNDPRIALLHNLGLPFVVHGRSSDVTAPYAFVDVNNRRAFLRATGFLLDLGHRRIALLNGPETCDFAFRRRAGFEQALTEQGVAADPHLMRSGAMTEQYGYTATQELLNAAPAPTAFVVSSLMIAYGVRRAVEEAGLKLGRDISLVSYDDELSYMENAGPVPSFTTTRSSVRKAGNCAATLLIDLIANRTSPEDAARESKMLEAELIVGQSTGPAPE